MIFGEGAFSKYCKYPRQNWRPLLTWSNAQSMTRVRLWQRPLLQRNCPVRATHCPSSLQSRVSLLNIINIINNIKTLRIISIQYACSPGDALMLATHKHGALPGQLLSAGAVAVLLTHLLEPRVDVLREETWRYQIRVFCISQSLQTVTTNISNACEYEYVHNREESCAVIV